MPSTRAAASSSGWGRGLWLAQLDAVLGQPTRPCHAALTLADGASAGDAQLLLGERDLLEDVRLEHVEA